MHYERATRVARIAYDKKLVAICTHNQFGAIRKSHQRTKTKIVVAAEHEIVIANVGLVEWDVDVM